MGGWPGWAKSLAKEATDRVRKEAVGGLVKALLTGVGALLLWLLATSGLADLVEWQAIRWWEWVLIVVGICVAAVVLFLLGTWLRPRRQWYRWKVSEWSGIRRVYPVRRWGGGDASVKVKQRTAAENAIKEVARTSSNLKLLLVSGHRYIGSNKSPGLLDYGLAWGLKSVWERRLGIATPVQLENVLEPQWQRVRSVPPVGSETTIPSQR